MHVLKCLQITLEEHIMSNRRMAAAGVLNARAALNNQAAAAAAALMHPNALMYGQQRRPQNAGPPPILPGLPAAAMIEQKLHAQHNEIQRLLAENQRLAATHVALRQELAASQQEVQRAQSIIQGVQNDKEVQVRYHVEKPNMCFDSTLYVHVSLQTSSWRGRVPFDCRARLELVTRVYWVYDMAYRTHQISSRTSICVTYIPVQL